MLREDAATYPITGLEPGLSQSTCQRVTGREPELSGLRARAQAMRSPLILHSDDEPALLTLVSFILDRAGYRVMSTTDGHAALDLAENLHPDLILTDIMKPGMSGLELLSRLKAHPTLSAIPVVMMSACSASDVVSRALEMGAESYLVKPCLPAEIVQVISSVLGKEPGPVLKAFLSGN